MGSQRVRHNLATEQQQQPKSESHLFPDLENCAVININWYLEFLTTEMPVLEEPVCHIFQNPSSQGRRNVAWLEPFLI